MSPAAYSRLKLLFYELFERNAAVRKDRLRQLELEEPELAGELHALLAEHDQMGEFLESAGSSFEALVPSRVGNYQIERELGTGGSGRVFLASRVDDEFHRPVPLKLLYPSSAGRDFAGRLRLERRALAQLDHPNIAHLLDWGQAEDGAPFLAMEYVDGAPVDEYCRMRDCDITGRLHLFLQICDAVEHAHRHLIVHRDIKPANVFVNRDGMVKLLDFGIAKLLADDAATVTAGPRLTPAYASPEQVRGEAMTTATDVYSLGVLLYELLTGELPYRLSTRSAEEASRAVVGQEPLRPNLAPDLANILMKALRKEPERRYLSVEQMAADIRRYLDGLPVLASNGSRIYLVSRFVQRNRLAVALGSLAIGALVAGAAVTTWQWRAAELNLRVAEARYSALRGFAHAILSGLDQPSTPSQTEAAHLIGTVTVGYLDQLARDRVPDDQLQMDIASAYTTLGSAEGIDVGPNRGNTAAAIEDYNKAREILVRQWGLHRDAPHGIALLWNFVATGGAMADARQAADYFSQALPVVSELAARYPGDFAILNPCAIVFESRGKRLYRAGDLDGAIQSFHKALDFAGRALSRRPDDAKSLQTAAAENGLLCRMHALKGDFSDALAEGRESQRLGDRLLAIKRTPKTLRDTATNSLFLCEAQRRKGDVSGAAACIGPTFEQFTAIASEDASNIQAKWDVATAHLERGEILAARNLPDQAISNFREAVRLSKELSARDPLNFSGFRVYGASLVRLGMALAVSPPDVREAASLFDEGIDANSQARNLAPSDVYVKAHLARAWRGKARVSRPNSIETAQALRRSVDLWRSVRSIDPLDLDFKAGADEAERALTKFKQ